MGKGLQTSALRSKVFNISVVLVTFYFFLEANSKWINSYAGPYNIEVRRLIHCSEDTSVRNAQFYVRDSRTRHTQVLMFSGNMTMPFVLNDSLGVNKHFILAIQTETEETGWHPAELILTGFGDSRPMLMGEARVNFASWSSGGGWKENAFILKFDMVCASLKLMVFTQWNMFSKSIFGEELPCPLLAGIYRFEHVKVDLRKIPIKQFPYGKWRVDSMVVNHTEVRGCIRIFADTVPILD